MLAEARGRPHVDPGFIAFGCHPYDHVVGKAHDQGPGYGFNAPRALLRGFLFGDHLPVQPLHGVPDQIEGLFGRALQHHGPDIGIGRGLTERKPVIRIRSPLVADGPLQDERVETGRVRRIGRNVVYARQQQQVGQEPGRARKDQEADQRSRNRASGAGMAVPPDRHQRQRRQQQAEQGANDSNAQDTRRDRRGHRRESMQQDADQQELGGEHRQPPAP